MSVAIIGAGMAGITCARKLADHGINPMIFEKSRGLGGRLATRRVDSLRFDHGAQFVTARSDEFRQYLDQHAAPWRPKGAGDWFVGAPAMNALIKPMTEGLDIRLGEKVSPQRASTGWKIGEEHFDHVISTVPVTQARTLFPELTTVLTDVSVAPCWTLMIAFAGPPDWQEMSRFRETGIAWIAKNSSKPERDAEQECWVVHASADWSEAHLEIDKDTAKKHLIDLLHSMRGGMPEITYAAAHRWRYALTTTPLGQPYIRSSDQTLLVGGDWCLGARVEDAWESGLAMASALLKSAPLSFTD